MPRDILITGAFLAPSSRERDAEREQRLGGFDYRLVAEDDANKKETKADSDAEAEQSDSEQAPTDEPQAEGSSEESSRSSETRNGESEGALQSSRRPSPDAQARRNRRGN
jgi:hypothetical protein